MKKRIIVDRVILSGNLFEGIEGAYDEVGSTHNYAEILHTRYREYIAAEYPGAEVEIDIEVQNASGFGRCTVVVEEKENVPGEGMFWMPLWNESDDLRYALDRIAQDLYQDEWDEWAIEAEPELFPDDIL